MGAVEARTTRQRKATRKLTYAPDPLQRNSASTTGVSQVEQAGWVSFAEGRGAVCGAQDAWDLLSRCLEVDPTRRLSAADALQHSFLREQ